MSAPVNALEVLGRIAKTNTDFATTADSDFIVRVGESMLKNQAADLLQVSATVAELIEAAKYAREWIIEVGGHKGIQNAGTLVRLNAAIARAGGAA